MNTKIITQLEALFEAAPPEALRRSINHVFYNYLMHSKTTPNNFGSIIEDVYFLVYFLESADEARREEQPVS